MRDEANWLRSLDAADVGDANVADKVELLDVWLAQLHQVLDAGVALPADLQANSPIAQQVWALAQMLQDCRAGWALKWNAMRPAQVLADGFDGRVMWLVFGSFNAGKSSLCNFLAERFAAHGHTVRYFYLEAGRLVKSNERLHEGATETTTRMQGVCLGERLVLLDTPGLHSVTEENAALTRRFTDSADAALWLTSSTSPGQVQQLDELARELHRSKPLLPVLTRSDVIEEDEIDGEIRKCLRNKTPANRALQEADVAQRAQDKLRQLGMDARLLRAPVSVSVHAARAADPSGPDLQGAGFLRLYAALEELLLPALAYKQRKPAEVLLHHCQENVLGVLQRELLPAIAALLSALTQEQERLAQIPQQMLRAAWRDLIPELPTLMEAHGQDLRGLSMAVSHLADAQACRQAAEFLPHYRLPVGAEDRESISLQADASDPEQVHLGLQKSIRTRLDATFNALARRCEATLLPLIGHLQQLQQRLAQCEQALQDLEHQVRAGCVRVPAVAQPA